MARLWDNDGVYQCNAEGKNYLICKAKSEALMWW